MIDINRLASKIQHLSTTHEEEAQLEKHGLLKVIEWLQRKRVGLESIQFIFNKDSDAGQMAVRFIEYALVDLNERIKELKSELPEKQNDPTTNP